MDSVAVNAGLSARKDADTVAVDIIEANHGAAADQTDADRIGIHFIGLLRGEIRRPERPAAAEPDAVVMHLVIEDRRRRTLRINSNVRLGDIVSLDRGSGARRQIEAVTPGDLVARDHIGLVAVNADPRSLGGDLNRRDGIVQSMARHLNRRSQTGELVIGDGVAGRDIRNEDSRMQRAERVLADDVVRRVAEESDAGSAAGEVQVVKQVAAGVVQEQRGARGGQRRASR